MLSLNDPRWSDLKHAYGSAEDIPGLLRKLESLPVSEGSNEPWFSLWSSLAHQGDVYDASFAAVPHVVRALSINPLKVSFDYFAFPSWVEICRQRLNLTVPNDLAADYFSALQALGPLVGNASARKWDANLLAAAMSALAVSQGFVRIAEAAQELNEETAARLLKIVIDEE